MTRVAVAAVLLLCAVGQGLRVPPAPSLQDSGKRCNGCTCTRGRKGPCANAASNKPRVVVVTHAAGRMGMLLTALLHEGASKEDLTVRAVVRTDAEATKLRCELFGMRLVNGSMVVNPEADSDENAWLKPVVVGAGAGEEALRPLFDGATEAVLCSAAHTELVSDARNVVREYMVSVPEAEAEAQSSRLLAEIKACAASKTLEHVVLRSTMGVTCAARCDADACDIDESWAVERMGGGRAMAAAMEHEAAMKRTKVPHTIVRLGALTDGAGNVPLAFGADDSLLLQSAGGSSPPYLSRTDAARVAVDVLRKAKEYSSLNGATLECAWGYKWGRGSAGTDEAMQAVARQDIVVEALCAANAKTAAAATAAAQRPAVA